MKCENKAGNQIIKISYDMLQPKQRLTLIIFIEEPWLLFLSNSSF